MNLEKEETGEETKWVPSHFLTKRNKERQSRCGTGGGKEGRGAQETRAASICQEQHSGGAGGGQGSRGRSPEGDKDAWGSGCAEGNAGPSRRDNQKTKQKQKAGEGWPRGRPGRMSVGSGGVGGPQLGGGG